jgi:hypothetical protein
MPALHHPALQTKNMLPPGSFHGLCPMEVHPLIAESVPQWSLAVPLAHCFKAQRCKLSALTLY